MDTLPKTLDEWATFEQILAAQMPRLRRVAARFLKHEEDAEDALQNALVSVLRNFDKFENRAQLSTWMHVIVANAAKSILRTRKRQALTISLDQPIPSAESLCLSDSFPDKAPSLEDEFSRAERLRILANMIRELPAQSRSIIFLCDFKEVPLKHASERLGLTVSAAKSRHARAYHRLLKSGPRPAQQACCRQRGQALGSPEAE